MAFFLVFCSVATGDSYEENDSLYAVIRVDEKEKLYTKGDILYSETDITKCFRIQDIYTDFLILREVNSKDIFKVERGKAIPLKGDEKIFIKTVKIDL